MSFNFIIPEFHIGSGDGVPTIQMFRRGFVLGGSTSPSWQDIILSGTTALTLTNALANGLNYLKLFGKCEQRNIPSEFTQVEYLESDGNQYIDTGYAPNVNTEVKTNFSTTTLPSTDAYMFHSSDGGNARISLAITQHLAFFGGDLNNSGNRVTLSSFTENTAYDITVNKDKTIVNGTEYTFTHTGVTLPTMGSIGLFGTRTGNLKCQGRVKSFSCNENNVLRINLIPCRRNSDNVLGMYDTVTGNFLTNSGTGSFTAGADVTAPSPDYPMDIVCNNGAVKAKHQSGLPLEYTLLDYIESTGTQYIDTGYKPNDKTSINIKYYPAISSTFMCLYGTQDTIRSNRFYGLISSTQFRVQVNSNAGDTPNFWGINNDGTLSVDTNGTFAQTQGVVTLGVDNKNKVISVKSDEYTGDISASDTVLGDDLDCSYNLLLLSRGTAGVAANYFKGRIYSFVIKDNNVLVQNLIPARRNSDNVIGMYDLVSQTFFTNAGEGDFTAGNTVSDPIAIYADGTVETVEITGKNLFDVDWEQGAINGTLLRTYEQNKTDNLTRIRIANEFYVDPTKTYTISINDNNLEYVFQVYDSNHLQTTITGSNTWGDTAKTFTGVYGIAVAVRYKNQANIDPSVGATAKIQLEFGSTATTYEPYYYGGTATAEMLLKVGTYQDVQSVLDGGVTHRCGIKVLDGTEEWTFVTGSSAPYSLVISDFDTNAPSASVNVISTHLQGIANSASWQSYDNKITSAYNAIRIGISAITTLADFKQYLASQYNSGNPVIVVYPLATATTETVTGQPLTTQAGTNIVEITQSAIDNLGLEVSYKATV